MANAHRNNDPRTCGALTVVTGQNKVYAGSELISVVGDPNSHGNGNFLDNGRKVFINGKRVIGVGDAAETDNASHANPAAQGFIGTIFIG